MELTTLRKERRALDITQKSLAGQVGISSYYYSEIENGKRNPNIRLAVRIAKILGRKVDDFEEFQ